MVLQDDRTATAPHGRAGFAPAEDAAAPEDEHEGGGLSREEALRILLTGVAALAVWFGVGRGFILPLPISINAVTLIGVLGLVVGGWPIFSEAAEHALQRRMTMELSMSIAIVAAAAISEFFTALVITLFVLVAEVLEGLTVGRGRRAIRDLLDVLPHVVRVRRAGGDAEIPLGDLRVGDVVLVAPGGRIPADGVVVGGHSFVDQASVTGESLPVEKQAGDALYAGTINQMGALEFRAERIGPDTSFGRIVDVVERAERSRAPVQRLADRLAGYLVYFALGAAALTFLLTRNVTSTISVIIVAGACGIAAGTPLAILGGIGRSARRGAIVKGGLFLETLGRVDTVVLDKTGTLTFGQPEVRAVIPAPGVTEAELLDAAAAAELRSEHPLGLAIVGRARAEGRGLDEPERFRYTPGRGVRAVVGGADVLAGNRALLGEAGIQIPDRLVPEAHGASEVLVARDGMLLGAILVADAVRPEARRAVQAVHGLGIRTLLLTGDNRTVAEAVGKQLGIDQVEADLLPDAKHARIRDLVAAGRVVAMVGDGVNDAPALTAAHVGVAMGSGTGVARESADVVLLGNDLLKFSETLAIARWTRRIIWQNFVGTITVDLVGMGLAAVGLLNPLLAAFIHVASELTFILNSARLLPAAERAIQQPGGVTPADRRVPAPAASHHTS
jgi:Cd2+/Zn2+-exporting ATPase/Cu+-exporting ATPase